MPMWLNRPCKTVTCCCQLQISTGGKQTHPSTLHTYSPARMDEPQEI